MPRSLRIAVLLFTLLPLPSAFAALEMSVQCTPQGNSAQCTATTTNRGESFVGYAYTGFILNVPPGQGTLTNFTNSLGLTQCLDSSFLGPNEQPFVFCFDLNRTLPAGASFTTSVRVTSTGSQPSVSLGAFSGIFSETTAADLSAFVFTDLTAPSCSTSASIAPLALSGTPYIVAWPAVSEAGATYELQESTSSDFSANVQTVMTTATSSAFTHTVTSPTRYYYRVRAVSCGGSAGAFSGSASTLVQPLTPQPTTSNIEFAVPFGTTAPVRIPIRIPGAGAGAVFSATVDKPYFSLDTSSGPLPPEGITLNIIADPRDLPPGASTGTLSVQITTPNSGRQTTTGSTTTTAPVSVSLVTPVTSTTKTLDTNALIIPVVTHVNGAAGPFLSDVRLTNDGAAATTYQVTLTPTRKDATQSQSTKVTVAKGDTIALNDIMKNFYGVGATSDPADAGAGSLDIRPVGSTNSLTFASSRTYAKTPAGTFGQFIAAVPFAKFATREVTGAPVPGSPTVTPPLVLSLQQIAQSSRFRTNLGIVEGAGSPANGRIRVLSITGALLAEIPYSLQAGEHQQMNSFLAGNGISNLEDGRIEITIDSPTGAVSAYASVLDNITTDPLAVMPANPAAISSTRYVLPGVADLPGSANFHSDIRVFNGGSTPATVNMTYYPQLNPADARPAAAVTIAPGEVKVFDNVLPTVFNATSTGGAIVMTTGSASSLVVTGRTYSIGSNGGTFGQFIPGVTPNEGIGAGDRPLQILQLEESQNFRSNVGLSELSGNPVTVKVSLYLPDKVSVSTEVELKANEFQQLNSAIARRFGISQPVYNARMTVQVVGGSGRVTAYGSVIDNATNDSTYVPAQ